MKNKDKFDALSDLTNRSLGQTKELFALVGEDFNGLVMLEAAIKKTHAGFCPSTHDEATAILKKYNNL